MIRGKNGILYSWLSEIFSSEHMELNMGLNQILSALTSLPQFSLSIYFLFPFNPDQISPYVGSYLEQQQFSLDCFNVTLEPWGKCH